MKGAFDDGEESAEHCEPVSFEIDQRSHRGVQQSKGHAGDDLPPLDSNEDQSPHGSTNPQVQYEDE